MKDVIKSALKSIGYAVLCCIILIGIWFLDLLNSAGPKSNLNKIVLGSILYSIPLLIIILLSSFFIINAKDKQEKFPYVKIFFYSFLIIILNALIFSIFLGGSPESFGFGILFIIKQAIYTIVTSLIFLGLIKYFYLHSEKKLVILLVIVLVIVSLIIIIKLVSNGGCLPNDYICFAEQAIKDKNQDFCEKTSASVYDCRNYYNYQLLKESNQNSSVCEAETGELRDSCFIHIVRETKNPEYCKSIDDDCSRINCCMWAYSDKEFISKEEAMKCGVANDQIGCGNRKFISK